jgi:hypothetical protein
VLNMLWWLKMQKKQLHAPQTTKLIRKLKGAL